MHGLETLPVSEKHQHRLQVCENNCMGEADRWSEENGPEEESRHQEGGGRKIGRPRMRWRDCIERDMRKAELEDVDWRMVAQDRGHWRRVVHRAAETGSQP